jgi:DNA-binding CsgD family transcriptional regulator
MASSTVMVLGCDADGRVRAASSEFLTSTGLASSSLYGRRIEELGKDGADHRLRLALADGSEREFETNSCSLDAQDGAEISSVVVLTAVVDPVSRAVALGVSLSEREGQILEFVADGYRVATIARRLFISPSTVRNHLSSIFKKLGVANQAQLLERLKQG